MSLTQEQIKKLAENLSKITLDDPKLTEDINKVLNYMDLLKEVDTSGVKPTISVVEKENILREDIKTEKEISKEELLNCSKRKVINDQIAISNIM